MPGDGDLGYLKRDVTTVLKRDVTTVAHNLRTNLDELLLQGRHRPVFDRLRRRQRAQEITEFVREKCIFRSRGARGDVVH